MLLDEEEEEDLKHRQQAFLRTRRVKRTKVHEEYGNGSAMKDDMMIDTSSSAVKKKEFTSPAKQKKQNTEVAANGIPKSSLQNIFATIKT